ncbi:hypothetical protein HPB51_025060 [Rhipicephalus microplus]|uniref:Chitinase n=1 Tax=Rhipicephalus microplus TaxID=6941 RepID=A0A9J6DKU9_RHIMP|nr:hypothetical protein HPB51_025060 [Rhipicephalus microplus]
MSPRKLWHRTSNTSFGPKSLKPFRRCISNHQSQRLSRTPPSLLGLRNSVCRMLNLPRHPMSCLQPQLRRRIPTRDLQLHFTVAQTLGGRQIIGPSVSPVVSLDTSPATVAEIPLQSTPWAGQWRRRLGRHQVPRSGYASPLEKEREKETMECSQEGSLLFGASRRSKHTAKASNVEDGSTPPPRSPSAVRRHRRISHGIRINSKNPSQDPNYINNSDSFPILHAKSRKRSDAPSSIYNNVGTTSRRVSLPSRHPFKDKATHATSSASHGPSTSSKHRPGSPSKTFDGRRNETLPGAARRHSQHVRPPDLDGDVTPNRILSPVTLATVTGSRYTSHARASKELQQQLPRGTGRHMSSSPQRTRAVVLSKAWAPSPSPPIDEFKDIPPVELILFEPPIIQQDVKPYDASVLPLKSSPPRDINRIWKQGSMQEDATHLRSSPPLTAIRQPALHWSDNEEPSASAAALTSISRVTCLQIWALCIATTTLIIPLAMIILSYLVTPVRRVSNLTFGPSATTMNYSSNTATAPSYTFPISSSQQTANPWIGVPQECRQVHKVTDNITSVNPLTSPSQRPSRSYNTFCLYNNSRFHRGRDYDFLPQNIPFNYCRSIVYWSYGIRDGVPVSRAETFDRMYGLEKLSDIANKSGVPGIRILLGVGGYTEDYAQLALLGRDSASLSRFAHHTIELMASHLLHGVVIHWLEGEPVCRGGAVDGAKVLSEVFLSLLNKVFLNNFSGQLAVIVSASMNAASMIIEAVIGMIDSRKLYWSPLSSFAWLIENRAAHGREVVASHNEQLKLRRNS